MIDPILFTFKIGSFQLALHWYGIIVVTAVMIAAWLAGREIKRRGGDAEFIWDALPLILLVGVIGARIWYVANHIVGGGTLYLQDPWRMIMISEGGLHIYGGFLFGGIAFLLYARHMKTDVWMLLDSIAPYLLIGQAIARPANYINQELYGPPTTLPWGIPIDAFHRMAAWRDLALFPEATTRFHPTFAYEMIWNFCAAALLIWLSRRFISQLRPGVIFFAWMVMAGLGRAIIETWRPDQPVISALGISTSRLVSLLMALTGLILLLARQGVLPFWNGPAPQAAEVRPAPDDPQASAGSLD